jgi:hypothetical protein
MRKLPALEGKEKILSNLDDTPKTNSKLFKISFIIFRLLCSHSSFVASCDAEIFLLL